MNIYMIFLNGFVQVCYGARERYIFSMHIPNNTTLIN